MTSRVLQWTSYQLWKVQCRLNRPLLALIQERVQPKLSEVWELDTARLGAARPTVCVVITTHRRPQACADLLRELHATLPSEQREAVQLIVLEDVSASDYAAARELGAELFGERFLFLRSRRWLGKQHYYLTYQAAFELLRRAQPIHSFFIQDDVTLAPDFFARALQLWDAIPDPEKAVLSLISIDDDEELGRWTRYRRQELRGGRLRKTQWFDLQAYLVGQSFFEALHYHVFPADPMRFSRTGISSGVGEQLTRRLWQRRNIYQVVETLVFHGGHASVMNTDARRDRPLDNRLTAAKG